MAQDQESERRQSSRLLKDEKLYIQILAASEAPDLVGETQTCTSVDISATGIKLEVSQEVPVDSEVEMWVDVKSIAGKYYLYGIVKWCYSYDAENNIFHIGIEFQDKSLTDFQQWHQFLETLSESTDNI